jgi:transcriptional regulator with XRE-family HTH domain
MAHASLSAEGQLQQRLNAVNCSLRSFSNICGISLSTLSRILSGERSFTASERENVEDCLDEMGKLQLEINQKAKSAVGIDWSARATADTIAVRKIARYMVLVDGDHGLEKAAQQMSNRTPTLRQQ